MSRRTTAIAAALSVLALGSPLIAVSAKPFEIVYFNNEIDTFEEGDYQGASINYTNALKIDLQDPRTYLDRASAKYELGDYQGAIADCSMAISINPKLSRAYHNRGAAKQKLNLHKSAIYDFDRAIELEENNAILYHYYNNRAWSKYNIGILNQGLADADRSIELNHDYMESFDTRGRIKRDLGDRKGACLDFKKSLSLGNQTTAQYLNSERGIWCRYMQN